MKNLFLSSVFSEVSDLFVDFVHHENQGRRVTFIPTAANLDADPFYVDQDRVALEEIGLRVDVLDISGETINTIQSRLRMNDYIFVAGGNTFFLLQELKKFGADKALVSEIRRGKPYIGSSAGSTILSSNIEYLRMMDDCSFAPELQGYDSLGVIDFYPLPHYKNGYFSEVVEAIVAEYGPKIDLRPFHDTQVIQVFGDEIRMVGSPPLR